MQAHLTVTQQNPFERPIRATLKGHSVTILAMGDVEGKSPAFLYTDTDGQVNWESMGEFTIIDTNYLPASEESLRALGTALQGTLTGSRR